jgi:enoyl-CoA hydratase/carnithine racemase
MWAELARFGRTLPGDVRVVVVRGEGLSFSSGLDLAAAGAVSAELAALPEDEAQQRIAGWQEGFGWLRRVDLVSIAAVQATRSAPASSSRSPAICGYSATTRCWR